jgi:D-alanyl-D-alanine carboxypeptidase
MNDPFVYQKRFFSFISIVLFVLVLVLIVGFFSSIKKAFFKERIIFTELSNVTIEAQSIYILDATSGEVILEKDATTVRPIASITKIMTALVALDIFKKEDIIPATLPNAIYKNGMVENILLSEKWSLDELVKLMLTKSSNEAAEALVEFARNQNVNFVELMNRKAKILALWNMTFSNSTGLDMSPSLPGALGTAEDIAFMFKYALDTYPEVFEPTTLKGYNTKSEQGTGYFVENTNQIAPYLQGLTASKTGYTHLAGGNLVFALDVMSQEGESHTVVVVLLGSTKEGRFFDAEKITQALVKDYKNQ